MMTTGGISTRDPTTSVHDRWGAVTTVSRLLGGRTQLRLVFGFGNTYDRWMPLCLKTIKPLIEMRVIALGRWTLVPGSDAPEYLLFETNWSRADLTFADSGVDPAYIPDLARTMQFQWRSIWGRTQGFPGPVPTTKLLEHIDTVDKGADHYWSDYDTGATTQVILEALELRRHLTRFLKDTRGTTPGVFQERWNAFVLKVQHLL